MKVLVVDDDPDVRLLLRLQLESHGYEVTGEAADGSQALAECRRDQPDAVILDLLMPNVNGFETIPHLRTQFPDVAIVAYTAVAGDVVRNEMSRLKIPLVLKNPHFAPIGAALETAVAQRRAASGAS